MEKTRELNPELMSQFMRNEISQPKVESEVVRSDSMVRNQGLSAVERKLEKLVGQLQEFAQLQQKKFERVAQALQRLETQQRDQTKEFSTRLQNLTTKVNEGRANEMKVQEMVDRHNTLVRNFENRLVHLQRVLTEQEMQLLSGQSALDEARTEIQRLTKK